MNRSTWKATERRVAKAVGGKRNPLSGGNSLHTTGDVIHPTLYLEVKHRARFQILTLMKLVEKLAKRELKIPVLVLQETGRKTRYYMVSEDVFLKVFAMECAVEDS